MYGTPSNGLGPDLRACGILHRVRQEKAIEAKGGDGGEPV